MRTLNLGILAHVDAGKTSLTERLLHSAGVIDEIGSVDDGSTQTDSLALERQRGITIKSAVVSFVVGDVTVNLIDTPGPPGLHRRGGAGARRARRHRAGDLRRRGRAGADPGADAGAAAAADPHAHLREQDRPGGRAHRAGACGHRRTADAVDRRDGVGDRAGHARDARSRPTAAATPRSPPGWPRCSPSTTRRCWPSTCATRPGLSYRRLSRELAAQARQGLVHPVFFGSAITGAGVAELTAGLAGLLPATHGDAAGPAPARCSRSSGGRRGKRSRTSGCSPARCTCGTGCRPGRARRSPRSACSSAARRSRASRSAPGRSASSGACATSRSATRSACRPRGAPGTGSPRPRWKPS